MGSLVEELRRREAAARAEADRLRSRIEGLAEELARAEEQVTRLVIAREEVARVLEGPAAAELPAGPAGRLLLHHPARDDGGAQILSDLTSRGINLVANAAAQSADHIGSYFTMLRAELGFYVGCLNLAELLAAKGVPVTVRPGQAVIVHVLVRRPARRLP